MYSTIRKLKPIGNGLRKTARSRRQGDIFWDLEPLLKTCRIFGMAPFPIVLGERITMITVTYSLAFFVESVAFAVINLLRQFMYDQTPSVENVASWFRRGMIFCVILVNSAVLLKERSDLHSIFLLFVKFDERLEAAEMKVEATLRSDLKREMLVFWFSFFLASSLNLPVYWNRNGVVTKLSITVTISAAALLQLLHRNVLKHLKERRTCVNEDIRRFVILDYDGASRISGKIVALALRKRCRMWRSLDHDLHRVSTSVERVFGPSVLFQVIHAIGILVVMLFVLIGFLIKGEISLMVIFNKYLTLSWGLVETFVVILIVGMSNSTYKQLIRKELRIIFWYCVFHIIDGGVFRKAASTGALVSEVLLKVKDHQARRELRLFSHQLFHTKVRFTACGLFTLDFKLLTSMTAAVVTHLVILVQFQFAGKSTSPTCNCH